MTVFAFGSAGFIGSNFVLDWLAKSDEKVINLDALTYAGNLENLSSLDGDARHLFVKGSIGDFDLVAKLLAEHQPRAIVIFAAESHVDRSIHAPKDFIQTNIVGAFRLFEAVRAFHGQLEKTAKNEFRFLHVSTDEVYGSLAKDDWAFTETHQYEPNSRYSASKAASDYLVHAYHHTYGLPAQASNCSNNYDPYHYRPGHDRCYAIGAPRSNAKPAGNRQKPSRLAFARRCSSISKTKPGGQCDQ